MRYIDWNEAEHYILRYNKEMEILKKIIEDFKTTGGKHCITNALTQVFEHHGYNFTEEMLFGIGEGLGFIYLNLANAPMVGGRSKPFVFEETIGVKLNIEIKCKSTKKYERAYKRAKEMIDSDKPVLIYADMPYLNYLNLEEYNHFGGHAVVLFGYDDEYFYVSDRDNNDYPVRTPRGNIAEDFHKVSYDEIEKARSSNHKPFPANNKWIELDFTNYEPITRDLIIQSVKNNCEAMLNSPAKLLGINGIKKFSNEVLKWNKFEEDKLKLAGVTNYFMISPHGGTGGGIFRKMYGDFLIQSSIEYGICEYRELGEEYILVADRWEQVGALLWELSENADETLLKKISQTVKEIAEIEEDILRRLNSVE